MCAGSTTTYFRPNNATLLVVGDVKPDDVERRVRALFGGWERARGSKRQRTVNRRPRRATTIYLVDKPGAAQSSFRIGGVGVARSTQDYFPLTVMNTALGGSFTSRLNQNLRETKAYTYGASSGFRHAAHARAVHRERRSRRSEDRLRADRVHEGAARDSRHGSAGRAREDEALSPASAAGPIRDHGRHRGSIVPARAVRRAAQFYNGLHARHCQRSRKRTFNASRSSTSIRTSSRS